MAREDFANWLPIEVGSQAFTAIQQNSAVESVGRHEPMNSDVKEVPRSGGVTVGVVARGGTYGENAATDDVITLSSKKFASAVRIADEDLQDSPANIIAVKQGEWANSYAKLFDHAALGVSAAANGTTIPFESVYRAVSQYNSGANLVATTTGVALKYDDLSNVLAKVEQGDYFGNLVVIAHPGFRAQLRGIKDTAGNPIFVQGLAGTPDTLFGVEIRWSMGARKDTTAKSAPTGNQLLIVANRDALVVGDRVAPETTVIPGWANTLTDESVLKGRARKAFALAHPAAAAVLELVP